MSAGFQVRIMKEFTPGFLQAARGLYLENRWINEKCDPAFPGNAFSGSFAVAALFTSENKVAGVGRAISDGVSDAYIQDIMVKKEFRGKGLGKMIVRALVDELKERRIEWIGLVGVPGTERFYKECGLQYAPGHSLWLGGEVL